MREVEFTEVFLKRLEKIEKKNSVRYLVTIKKIEQICSIENLEHYKNLRYDFVLLFKIEGEKIILEDLLHHKKAYRRR